MLTFYMQHILNFYALTFISKTRRNWLGISWVQYRYFREVLEGDWERQSKPGVLKIFLVTLTARRATRELSKFPCLCFGQAETGWREAF